jgi:acyl-CoA thioester hydrolase
MAGLPFRHQHRVTYSECTLGNHVYYARYLDWLEVARGEFLRSLGLSFAELQKQEVILPVIECHLRYKAAARYDDLLNLEVWPSKVEKVRLNFGYRVTAVAGQLILEAETWHVCANLKERPKRMPEFLVARLSPFQPASGSGVC